MLDQTNANIERHIKTHSVRSDDDRAAVSVLETFLRQVCSREKCLITKAFPGKIIAPLHIIPGRHTLLHGNAHSYGNYLSGMRL